MKNKLKNLETKFQNQVYSQQPNRLAFLDVLSQKRTDEEAMEKQAKIKEMANKLAESKN